MTKILLSPLISEARGKIGSIVFSKNRHGHYIREDKTHINVDALRAAGLIGIFRDISLYWKNILLDAERSKWNQWARNSPLTNTLGETYHITGINAFIRTNVIFRTVSGGTHTTPPTLFGQGKRLILTQSGFIINSSTQEFIINSSTDIDGWNINLPDDYVIIYMGTAQTPGTNFFKQPYKILTWLEGDAIPPTFPFIVPMPFLVSQYEKVWVALQHLDPTGLISTRSIAVITAHD